MIRNELMMIGHEIVGRGERRVFILNDWLCDTSTWDGARPYLDQERFTWAFADLRGYGRSRGKTGAFGVLEAAGDVLELANALGWKRFAVVGHSMSTLVALHLAQHYADRVERIVVITPPPPAGFGADDSAMQPSISLALGDDELRTRSLGARFGERLSRGWSAFKLARWRETADAEAAAAYVAMFARDGVPDPNARVKVPVLALTGEEDMPLMRREAVTKGYGAICDHLEVIAFVQAGHYPMQEMPPRTVATVERFLDS